MLTLAIDTATRTLSVALIENQIVLAEFSKTADQLHAELLPELIDELFAKTKKSKTELQTVAVGVGPGAYTGLRVGLMFAHAFAKALDLQVIGICTHDVIAPSDFTGFVVTDARRKEVYLSQYQAGQRIAGPKVIKPTAIENSIVIGDGVVAFPEIFKSNQLVTISAGALGQKVNAALAAGLEVVNFQPKVTAASSDGAGAIPAEVGLLLPAVPLYLRRPDVMEPK